MFQVKLDQYFSTGSPEKTCGQIFLWKVESLYFAGPERAGAQQGPGGPRGAGQGTHRQSHLQPRHQPRHQQHRGRRSKCLPGRASNLTVSKKLDS